MRTIRLAAPARAWRALVGVAALLRIWCASPPPRAACTPDPPRHGQSRVVSGARDGRNGSDAGREGGTQTKIVATIGPASRDPAKITSIVDAGASVLRLNFSHGTHEYHSETLAAIESVRAARPDKYIAVAIDIRARDPARRACAPSSPRLTACAHAPCTPGPQDSNRHERRRRRSDRGRRRRGHADNGRARRGALLARADLCGLRGPRRQRARGQLRLPRRRHATTAGSR